MIGLKNVYKCPVCNEQYVTEDKDEGVTPYMLKCFSKDCHGICRSGAYHKDFQSMTPKYIWRNATLAEIKKMSPPMREHINNGGLLLANLDESPII